MAKLGFPSSAPQSTSGTSSTTEELAWELQQERPDPQRIKWLIEDMEADVNGALKKANLKAADLLKNPHLRPHLQRHLH